MSSLFFSYSRRNIDIARMLTEAFKGENLDFWIDWEGIPPTVDWWKEIEKGIEEADNFLFLLSPDSAKSKVCKQEIEHAAKNGKRLIPIVVCDVKEEDIPSEFRHLNWIFLREADDFKTNFNKLVTAIKTDYEWVQTHRQLQVKALEWERSGFERSFLLRGKELQDSESQLASNTSKVPHPTDLQREYVHQSRQATDRQRRTITSIAIAGAIALAVLAVFGFVQAGLARNAQAAAENNLTAAQTARSDSVIEANQRATAQVQADNNAATAQAASRLALENEARAVANEALAKEQANIALSRQLAAQAMTNAEYQPDLALLLAVESSKLAAELDAEYRLEVTGSLLRTLAVSPGSVLNAVVELPGMTSDMWSGTISPDRQMFAAGGRYGSIWLWNTTTGQMIDELQISEGNNPIMDVEFSPDNKTLASASCVSSEVYRCQEIEIRLWKVGSDQPHRVMIGQGGSPIGLAISPDGKFLAVHASSINNSIVGLWNLTTGQPIDSHIQGTVPLLFSPDGGTLAVGGVEHNTVQLWDFASQQSIGSPLPHEQNIIEMTFSHSGKILALAGGDKSGQSDKIIRLWDLATQKQIGVNLVGRQESIISMMFSPDGSMLVSGSVDGTVRLWDTTRGLSIGMPFTLSGRPVVAFSKDGKTIMAGDGMTFQTWNIDLEYLAKRACQMANRNLTRAEYRIFINSAPEAYDTDYAQNSTCEGFPVELKTMPMP